MTGVRVKNDQSETWPSGVPGPGEEDGFRPETTGADCVVDQYRTLEWRDFPKRWCRGPVVEAVSLTTVPLVI